MVMAGGEGELRIVVTLLWSDAQSEQMSTVQSCY